jgi:hypothetical protein
MFRAKFPSISSHISQNATPGTQLARCHHPTLTGRFTKNTQSETSEVLRLPRKMTTRISKVLRRSTHLLKTTRTCHKKTTRYETCWCWNVTKRHACHAKRGYATFETSKSDCFAELATGTVILLSRRSLADTCERLKAQRTRFNPQTPKVKREPFAAFRNKCKLCCLLDVSGTDRKERNPYCQLARRKNHHYITGTPFKPNKKQFQYSA